MNRLRVAVPGASALFLVGLTTALASGEAPPPPSTLPAPAVLRPLSGLTDIASPDLFDPARHMRVSEVRPGMTGYGLTVFSGTAIEKFDVEVLSVLKNFNPKYDVVLIRCHGERIEHTGAVEGMSGSPIFLKDDAGKYRMIGAFAYGWPFSRDPVAGVQPIEYMLRLPPNASPAPAETAGGAADANAPPDGADENASIGRPRWTLADLSYQPWRAKHSSASGRTLSGSTPFPAGDSSALDASALRMQPLATPLMASGLSPRTLAQLKPVFDAAGLVALQAGAASQGPGTGTVVTGRPAPRLEPGGVLAVPLLTGDVELTAIGTVTEVIGDRVFGFGHPFNGDGRIDLPMGGGSIATVIANVQTSFKLGSMAESTGALRTDQQVGVAGLTGATAPTVPVEIRTTYADGSVDQTYHFRMAIHPKMTPMVAAAALGAAATGTRELPEHHTLDYDLDLQFEGGRDVRLVNKSVDSGVGEMFGDVAVPVLGAANNPFERVPLKKLSGTIRVTADAREARIVSVTVPREKYAPGETLRAFVAYQPFRSGEAVLPLHMELPRDLPDGDYTLVVSDAERYFADEQQAEPFKFTAESIDELFGVMRAATGVRRDAVYLRLVRQADGVAVGRVAMPKLPSSQRRVWADSGRSDVTAFVSSTVKIVPTPLVMNGSAEFSITIDRTGKTESAAGPRARPEPKPGGPAPAVTLPPAKAEEPKKP